jgi:hypothetical protein
MPAALRMVAIPDVLPAACSNVWNRFPRHQHGTTPALLMVGVDTDTDAIRVHVPDVSGRISVDQFVDNAVLFEATRSLSRADGKEAIRMAVADCARVAADDPASAGMRWFCGYLLKNNLGQHAAVRALDGGRYPDAGHTERLIVVGDAIDAVQLRNLVFQAQMETVEEGAHDLDIGIRILRALHEPKGLSVPVLIHCSHRNDLPGAQGRARDRAARLRQAVAARHADLVASGLVQIHAVTLPSLESAFSAGEGGSGRWHAAMPVDAAVFGAALGRNTVTSNEVHA